MCHHPLLFKTDFYIVFDTEGSAKPGVAIVLKAFSNEMAPKDPYLGDLGQGGRFFLLH
jgi:hypothetical protein